MKLTHGGYTLEVDEGGYFLGQCYEGALGVVLRVQEQQEGSWRALKIPRVLADSDRENYFISALTAAELKNARRVGAPPALVPLDGGLSFLQFVSVTGPVNQPQRQIILAQLHKARRPRFCAVRFDERYAVIEMRPAIPELAWLRNDESALRDILEGAVIEENEITQTIVMDEDSRAALARGLPNSQWRPLSTGRPTITARPFWFIGLPSPVYFWCEGTLEQAVRVGQRGFWPFAEHLDLIRLVAGGLGALYRHQLIHCDLRPANIMYDTQPALPGEYRLGDVRRGPRDRYWHPRRPARQPRSDRVGRGRRRGATIRLLCPGTPRRSRERRR